MCTFNDLWALLRQHGSSPKQEIECNELWNSYKPELQQFIFDTIRSKLEQNKFVHYNPMKAMQENARIPRKQMLSYKAYYARYGTTIPQDGWKMVNPTGQNVFYIKT